MTSSLVKAIQLKLSKLQTINYTNGDKYYGEISKDKKHGFGTYTWKDGSIYFGNWENNKKHGKGTFIDASGEELSAVWSKGKFKSQTYRIADESIDLNYLQKHLNLLLQCNCKFLITITNLVSFEFHDCNEFVFFDEAAAGFFFATTACFFFAHALDLPPPAGAAFFFFLGGCPVKVIGR